ILLPTYDDWRLHIIEEPNDGVASRRFQALRALESIIEALATCWATTRARIMEASESAEFSKSLLDFPLWSEHRAGSIGGKDIVRRALVVRKPNAPPSHTSDKPPTPPPAPGNPQHAASAKSRRVQPAPGAKPRKRRA